MSQFRLIQSISQKINNKHILSTNRAYQIIIDFNCEEPLSVWYACTYIYSRSIADME